MIERNITPAEERCTMAVEDLTSIATDMAAFRKQLPRGLRTKFKAFEDRLDNVQDLLENGY